MSLFAHIFITRNFKKIRDQIKHIVLWQTCPKFWESHPPRKRLSYAPALKTGKSRNNKKNKHSSRDWKHNECKNLQMKKLTVALIIGGDLSEKIMNVTNITKLVYICKSKSWRKLPAENFPNIKMLIKCSIHPVHNALPMTSLLTHSF